MKKQQRLRAETETANGAASSSADPPGEERWCPQLQRIRSAIVAVDTPVVRLCGWPASGRRRLIKALAGAGWEGLSPSDVARRRSLEGRLEEARRHGSTTLVADLLEPAKVRLVADHLRPGERLVTSWGLDGGLGGALDMDPGRVLTVGPAELFLVRSEIDTVTLPGTLQAALQAEKIPARRASFLDQLWNWSGGWLGPVEAVLQLAVAPGGELLSGADWDAAVDRWLELHVWQGFSTRQRLALLQGEAGLGDVFTPGMPVPALLQRWLERRHAESARLAEVGARAPRVRIRLFGAAEMSLVVGDRVEHLPWPFRRVQQVLGFLALSPECSASRERIVATLWPDESEEVAVRNLHPAVSHLRRLLGPNESHGPAILRQGEMYRLNPDWAWEVDVWRFEELVSGGVRDTDAGQDARRIYRGPLLEGTHLPWVDEQRERLAALRNQLLLELAGHYAADGRLGEAEECYRSLLIDDPLLEDVHLALMRLYAARGRPDLVRRQYERLSRLLIEELGSQPMDATVREVQRLIG
jgi:DNA-binding SARP family transcriptional activator